MEGTQEEEVHEFDFGADAAVDGCDALGDMIVVPGSAVSSEEATCCEGKQSSPPLRH